MTTTKFPFKLGLNPSPTPATFKLSSYLNKATLPKIPLTVGHTGILKGVDLQMLANDRLSCCVAAGAAHETMLWNLEQKRAVGFTEDAVIGDYSAVTGYNPDDPTSDQGTDMQTFASYRRRVGVIDGQGQRHKIDAYLALKPGDTWELRAAIYLFGAVGLGLHLPNTAMDQFNAGKPWDVVSGARVEGGHYVPGVARWGNGKFTVLTWGRAHDMTAAFYEKYSIETLAYVSVEMLSAVDGKSPEGFNLQQLLADLRVIK
jgi:hypothetical protein